MPAKISLGTVWVNNKVKLTPEEVEKLHAEATRTGTTVSRVINAAVRERLGRVSNKVVRAFRVLRGSKASKTSRSAPKAKQRSAPRPPPPKHRRKKKR